MALNFWFIQKGAKTAGIEKSLVKITIPALLAPFELALSGVRRTYERSD